MSVGEIAPKLPVRGTSIPNNTMPGNVSGVTGNATAIPIVNTRQIWQVAHGFTVGALLKYTGTAYAKAQADTAADAEVVGMVSVVNGTNSFVLTTSGYVTGLAGLVAGSVYFLDPAVAGGLTATEPSTVGQIDKPCFVADSTTSGYFINYRGEIVANAAAPTIADLRNFLFNGSFQIDQANEFASVALVSGGTAWKGDQLQCDYSSSATGVTAQIVTDAPSNLTYSLKTTVGTGGSINAGEFLLFQGGIEGTDWGRLNYGGASAQAISVSFSVKSSIAGTYSFALVNAAANRSYVHAFTISNANTWERKTINNIPGDTTGTWVATNAKAVEVYISISVGSTFQTSTLDAWQAGFFIASNTITNSVIATNAATFQIAGAQIEQSTTASAFQYTPFEIDLQRAMRHYRKSFNQGTAPAQNVGVSGAITVKNPIALGDPSQYIQFDPPMRANPTITTYNPSATNANWRDITATADATVSVDPSSTIGRTGVLIATSGTVATLGDILAIHYTADSRIL